MIDVTRGPAPEDVAKELSSGKYSGQATRRELTRIFAGKCYICEQLIWRLGLEVDHLYPKASSDDQRLVWENLFPACRHCNGRKLKSEKWRIGPGDGVMERLVQSLEPEGIFAAARFSAVTDEDVDAVDLASELERVHSPDGASDSSRTEDLLDLISEHFETKIDPLCRKAQRARARGTSNTSAENQLRVLLAIDQPFCMLMRSMVPPELADLIP